MKIIKEVGEYNSKINLKIKDIFGIKKGNIFWKYVDYVACKLDKIAKLYEKKVGTEYRKEMEEFDLNKCKKILHIGCGAYPVTALILSQLDNVKIVTIDKSHRSIEMAKEIIKKKDLENKIFAEQADGAIYPIDGFDTIIVSGCSTPKIPIYRNVIKNAKPYCKIIIRDEYLDVKSIVTDILPDMDLKITKKMENHAFTTSRWTSYCIQKNS